MLEVREGLLLLEADATFKTLWPHHVPAAQLRCGALNPTPWPQKPWTLTP